MNYLINFMAGNVNSQAQAGSNAGGGLFGGGGTMLLIFALFFVVLYFFSIRPQKKREKKQKEKLASIKKGDRIQTIGGWRGTIAAVKETTFIVRLEDGAKIEVIKNAVADVISTGESHGPGKGGNKDDWKAVEAVEEAAEKSEIATSDVDEAGSAENAPAAKGEAASSLTAEADKAQGIASDSNSIPLDKNEQ